MHATFNISNGVDRIGLQRWTYEMVDKVDEGFNISAEIPRKVSVLVIV